MNLRERELRTPEGDTWHITLDARRRRSILALNQPEALWLLACVEAVAARLEAVG